MNHSSVTLWYGMDTNYTSSKKRKEMEIIFHQKHCRFIYTLEKENFSR